MRWACLLVMAGCIHAAVPAIPSDPGLGTVHLAIDTTSAETQAHFDAGLASLWGFNYDEAIGEFYIALRSDPTCAMCMWGYAYAMGPNMNDGLKQFPGAYPEAVRAAKLAKRPLERALTAALVERLAPDMMLSITRRSRLDAAYLAKMREAAKLAPDNPDVQTLLAEALYMDTPPLEPNWDRKTKAVKFPVVDEARRVLEAVLARYPDHIGAIHFYIHTVDGGMYMDRAVPYAAKLPRLAPHAGHLVHMPSHLYLKLGRFADADDANRAAIAADRDYLARTPPGTNYEMFTMHPKQYLWYVLLWEGASAEAQRALGELRDATMKMAMMDPGAADQAVAFEAVTATRFAQWDRVWTMKDPTGPTGGICVEYARGLAMIANGRLDDADKQIAKILAAPTLGSPPPSAPAPADAMPDEHAHPDEAPPPMPGMPDPLLVKQRTLYLEGNAKAFAAQLSGAIAEARGDHAKAIAELRRAVVLEDAIPQMNELSATATPARQRLGAVLLATGKAAEAEAVYREDLERMPENGWALFGLAQALDAQHKPEAAQVRARFDAAWKRADITLSSSVL